MFETEQPQVSRFRSGVRNTCRCDGFLKAFAPVGHRLHHPCHAMCHEDRSHVASHTVPYGTCIKKRALSPSPRRLCEY